MSLLETRRNRELPIPVASVEVHGGVVDFALYDATSLEFAVRDEHALVVRGLRVQPYGMVRFGPHSFTKHEPSVVVDSLHPVTSHAHWHSDRDFNEPYRVQLVRSVERAVRNAVGQLLETQLDRLTDRLLDKLDDLGLQFAAEIAHWETAIVAGEGKAHVLDDLRVAAARKLAAIDEAGLLHDGPMQSAPGYVLLVEGRPLLKPVPWGPPSDGELGRLVLFRHLDAERTRREISNFDALIQRVRLIDGNIWYVRQDGLERAQWTIEDAIHTAARQPSAAAE